jgi:hypothetical protein
MVDRWTEGPAQDYSTRRLEAASSARQPCSAPETALYDTGSRSMRISSEMGPRPPAQSATRSSRRSLEMAHRQARRGNGAEQEEGRGEFPLRDEESSSRFGRQTGYGELVYTLRPR